MIKILPSGTSAILSYGIKPVRNAKAKGRLGRGPREYSFDFKSVFLRSFRTNTHIEAILEAKSELFIRNVSLIFRFKSPRLVRDLVVWAESYSGEFNPRKSKSIPGTLSGSIRRKGAWAIWISETTGVDGLLLKQLYPANYPIVFECRPLNHTLTISWEINHHLGIREMLHLPFVVISRGSLERLVSTWRHEWKAPTTRVFPQSERIGWCESGELKTQKDLLGMLNAIRKKKIGVNWFALGPQYASQIGDWLTPKNLGHMNMYVRKIMEQSIAPGLRLAPFLASKKSSLAAEKRAWFVRDDKGMPITVKRYESARDNCYVLDLSNPQVLNHIRKMFSLMREHWGFRAFYLERLGDGLAPGIRHKKNYSAGELLNGAAIAIRKAVGNRGLLAAADLPLLTTYGVWDAQVMMRSIEGNHRQMFIKNQHAKMTIASALLHRSAWNESSWINTAGLLPVGLFNAQHDAASSTLINAITLSCGLVCFSGDPREIDTETENSIKKFLSLFAECRKGRISLMPKTDGDIDDLLVVRNNQGWISLFNFSDREAQIHLDLNRLRSQLGVSAPLSAGNCVVFNSPEIYVSLPPRGHRLFRG
ncbi:hypothetical protein S1OALGB6SA_760 [Olavius algarvensis spirochete endosymbiont]|uniref:alpha-galactosidase n=1 Tax=Olavius algarvensis spirochete endosymbiont TaxID=260710 RepID=UPI000F10F88E|nr:alpha-galactosidase [Olavius algarvensis spirochete endosymbiont]VDA99689.1 hypothetical protein S1OALGB6SA_760 [Olavius algarvensis spirochete endosymbiont]